MVFANAPAATMSPCRSIGGPKVLAGSISPRAIRRVARWADGISGFSMGPTREEIAQCFTTARESWSAAGRTQPPRLVTACWFALGKNARGNLDEYLCRYLDFMGAGVAEQILPMVTTDSTRALRDVIDMVADLGGDELLLVPATADPDEVDRVADLIG